MTHQQGDLMKLCKRRDCFEERQGELGYCSFHEASGTDRLLGSLYPEKAGPKETTELFPIFRNEQGDLQVGEKK